MTEPASCEAGRHTDFLSCCLPEDPEDTDVKCTGDRCVSMVAHYPTCGGPISAFLVDSESNIYFWSGRWHLHSLDKHGNLRWRYDLCDPEGEYLCRLESGCEYDGSAPIPTVLDYYDNLHFFVGNTLYVISSDGKLLKKTQVDLPGLELESSTNLYIANGTRQYPVGISREEAGAPALTSNGNLVGPFTAVAADWRDFIYPTGVVEISRRGRVVDVFDDAWKKEPKVDLGFQTWVALPDDQRVYFTGARKPIPYSDNAPHRDGFIGLVREGSLQWSEDLERDFEVYSAPPGYDPTFEIVSQPAVGPNGRLYALSSVGAVYALDPESRDLRVLLNFQVQWPFDWYTRPVVAGDGTLYFLQGYQTSGSTLWAVDTDRLWEHPVDRSDLQDSRPPGVKWTFSRGPLGGGLGTPAIAADGTIYAPMNGLSALDPDTGEELWRFGDLTMGSSPTILPDGTIVVGQSSKGQVFFLRENVDNGGLAKAGWPQAYRDYYHSNNAAHPYMWDRSGEPPYPENPEAKPQETGCQCASGAAGRPEGRPVGLAFVLMGSAAALLYRRRKTA